MRLLLGSSAKGLPWQRYTMRFSTARDAVAAVFGGEASGFEVCYGEVCLVGEWRALLWDLESHYF